MLRFINFDQTLLWQLPVLEFEWRLGTIFSKFSCNLKVESITRKITLKISQFTKSEILPLDCHHVKAFKNQKN